MIPIPNTPPTQLIVGINPFVHYEYATRTPMKVKIKALGVPARDLVK